MIQFSNSSSFWSSFTRRKNKIKNFSRQKTSLLFCDIFKNHICKQTRFIDKPEKNLFQTYWQNHRNRATCLPVLCPLSLWCESWSLYICQSILWWQNKFQKSQSHRCLPKGRIVDGLTGAGVDDAILRRLYFIVLFSNQSIPLNPETNTAGQMCEYCS